MIFVILGTQDKSFTRLLEEIDRQVEKGNLKQEIIVQAGNTTYKSKNMKILGLISMKKFSKYIDESDYIITHGGVGTILDGIKKGKKVIAVPRLSKYGEHENDHQLQIVKKFSEEKYILGCNSVEDLENNIKKIKSFKPKKYIGDNNQMINLIDDYISTSKPNKRFEILSYLIFGFLTTFVNILSYFIFARVLKINYLCSNIVAWIITIIFAFLTNKKYVFDSNKDNLKMFIEFIISRIITLIIEVLLLILFVQILKVNDMISKATISIIIIILNYLLSKLCVFKQVKNEKN